MTFERLGFRLETPLSTQRRAIRMTSLGALVDFSMLLSCEPGWEDQDVRAWLAICRGRTRRRISFVRMSARSGGGTALAFRLRPTLSIRCDDREPAPQDACNSHFQRQSADRTSPAAPIEF